MLEVGDNAYTTRFGAGRVSESAVVDIDASNPSATLIADLQQVGSLARESYDCIIGRSTVRHDDTRGVVLTSILDCHCVPAANSSTSWASQCTTAGEMSTARRLR